MQKTSKKYRVSLTLNTSEYKTIKRWSDNLAMKPATLAKLLIFNQAKQRRAKNKNTVQLSIEGV